MARLSSLRLEALRGATQPFEIKFEASKSVIIIYGENGSGKSTICDGFDLLCNAKVGSLDRKGVASPARYWHSTNRKPTDVKITLTSAAGTWTGELAKGRLVVTPPDGLPKVAILRRHQILDLIVGRPADRYGAVRPFIAIDEIDESERALRDLINSIERQQTLVSARIGENLQTLDNIWKQVGSPAPSLFEWAESEAKRDTAELDEAVRLIQKITDCRNALASRIQDSEKAEARLETDKQALSTAEEALNKELQRATDGSEELTQLLQAARHFFEHQAAPVACPLCGSKEFAEGLPKSVEDKLKSLASLRAALNERDKGQKAVDHAEALVRTTSEQLAVAANSLCAACGSEWPADLPSPRSIIDISSERTALGAGSTWPAELITKLSAEASKLGESLEPELTLRAQRRSTQKTVRDALDQYRHNEQQKSELDRLLPRLKNAQDGLVHERQSFVDEILRRIAHRVGQLYEQVHPGEGLSKISLQLDPDKRASLDVLSKFPGAKDAPPGAYLSESHLDTLGLCIFIALVELDDPAETILVLDDVVASVDEPHVDRIIEMLYDVSERFAQCVLTTHYLSWREKFRWGFLKNGECQLIELGEWSMDGGVVGSKSVPRVDVLRNLLSEAKPEAQCVCACAGVIVEAVLDFLTRTYECAVPRRRTKPTLGDLLPAVKKKLRDVLRVEIHDTAVANGSKAPTIMLGEKLNKIEEFAQLRNVMGAHFNELAFQLKDADGIKFGEMVSDLADALVHPEHGWPASDKTGECWTNSKKSRRLFPLKQPS
jgi:energy-coupling factor transporter ATP-binding protein EcfA2